MSKIIELEIKNFRNIAHEIIDFKGGKSMVISGKNEIGKTNRITAILWLLAGVLFDGTAKDTLSNLIPETAPSGTTVSVKATFTDGQSIEKTYSRPYIESESGDLIPKDSVTKYIKNGGKPLSTVREGNVFIYEQLGLSELNDKFTKNSALKSINLAYLMLTTIGIRGLDNSTMRALIIDIVGDVSAYEMATTHKETYGLLLPLLERANNDINKVRDDLRFAIQDKTNGLEIRVSNLKSVIEQMELMANEKVDEVEQTNAQKSLNDINDQITKIEVKKQSVQSGSTDKIDLEISELNNKRNGIQNAIRQKYQEDIEKSKDTDLENQVRNKEDAYSKSISNVRVVESELSNEKLKLGSLESSKKNKQQSIDNIKDDVKELQTQYNAVGNNSESTQAFVTCPHCNQVIDLAETQEHKAIHEGHLKVERDNITKKVKALKDKYDELTLELTNVGLEIVKQQAKVNSKTNEHTTALTTRNTLEQELSTLRNKLNDLIATTKPTLNLETKEVTTINETIETLRNQKTTLLDNVQTVVDGIQTEIDGLKEQRLPLEIILDKKRVQQANLNALAPKRVEFTNLSNELTSTKELYALSKQLLIATFKELETRVELKFGSDVYFKLYEPNASDGGATFKTSICEMYVRDGANRLVPALANGVSTSMQEVRILEFIERLKAHYNVADSIILIDRLESLDDDKRKMLSSSKNQIITTAVRNNELVKYELL